MLRQGLNSDGEILSSATVEIDRANPALYVDFTDTISLTRQEFADECDINKLMAQYEKTGILPANMNNDVPRYLDVVDVPNLQEALTLLADSTTAFMALPATVRREFDNDAVKFVQFAQDPENLAQMRTWGLAPPAPEPIPPQKVEVVNPSPPEASKAV
ncbi:MAG: internal scaffolding protein [Microviridae sp.]|nr:MAG: internal scaffolding protein [Microviridae sp.]